MILIIILEIYNEVYIKVYKVMIFKYSCVLILVLIYFCGVVYKLN